jgi:hypothetical protein
VRTRTEGTAKPRAPLQSRTPCQACAASAFFCRPGSGARSVGRRTVPSSKPTPRPKSTRMPRSGLPRVFVRALACTSMQTFGGRCSCTSSVHVRSTQTASSQQHSRSILLVCGDRRTVAAPRHGAAAPQRAGMGIKRRPVESPGAHACAAAPRPPHTRLLGSHPYFR